MSSPQELPLDISIICVCFSKVMPTNLHTNKLGVLHWISSKQNKRFYTRLISNQDRAFILGLAHEPSEYFNGNSIKINERFYNKRSS